VTQQQRAAQRKWTVRLARSDGANDARCANCNACAPVGPCETGYSAAGVLERHWRCTACGNQWKTSARTTPVSDHNDVALAAHRYARGRVVRRFES
jgi:transposase-like protein